MFLAAVWVFGMFLGASFDKQTTDSGFSGEQENTLEYILDVKNVAFQQDELGAMAFVGINTTYFSTIWNMMTWDFSFFDNHPEVQIIRYIILVPITAGLVWGFLYVFAQIFQSLLSAIAG
jgi:hypothetical protein